MFCQDFRNTPKGYQSLQSCSPVGTELCVHSGPWYCVWWICLRSLCEVLRRPWSRTTDLNWPFTVLIPAALYPWSFIIVSCIVSCICIIPIQWIISYHVSSLSSESFCLDISPCCAGPRTATRIWPPTWAAGWDACCENPLPCACCHVGVGMLSPQVETMRLLVSQLLRFCDMNHVYKLRCCSNHSYPFWMDMSFVGEPSLRIVFPIVCDEHLVIISPSSIKPSAVKDIKQPWIKHCYELSISATCIPSSVFLNHRSLSFSRYIYSHYLRIYN